MSSLLRKVRSSTYVPATSRCSLVADLMAAEENGEKEEDGVGRRKA